MARAATPAEKKAFRDKYAPEAIEAAKGSPILPETILTAAALESGWGLSALSKYNNFGGIKWDARLHKGLKKVPFITKEQDKNGKWETITAYFVHYDTPKQYFQSYVKFVTGPRYIKAGIAKATTPEDQFKALKTAGYATALNYVTVLKDVLKQLGGALVNIKPTEAAAGGAGILLLVATFFF